jgi:DNA glycosylase AlkZ-like
VTTPTVSWRQALGWRMGRQLLDHSDGGSAEEVAARLCGVQAQVASSAELAVRVRSAAVEAGDVGAALADGRLVKTWAMRGTLHLFRPQDAGTYLALMSSVRSWERPIWQRRFGLNPDQVETLRVQVRAALASGPLTREELIERVTAHDRLDHIGDVLRSGWGTVLKPLAWHGDIVYGPSRGTRVTFQLPAQASRRWTGLPEPEVALPVAIRSYLSAYGPATPSAFSGWLSRGLLSMKSLKAAFAAPETGLLEVEVDGGRAWIRAEDVDELLASAPTDALRLLPGFDQWVLGPGTDDTRVIPVGRRTAVSRTAGWIAPIVVVGGVVSGTWELNDDQVVVDWFTELGRPPKPQLAAEAERLAALVGRPLTLRVSP